MTRARRSHSRKGPPRATSIIAPTRRVSREARRNRNQTRLFAGAREFHARDIKDLNGRPLITQARGPRPAPRETAQSGSRAFVFENSSPTRGPTRTDRTGKRRGEKSGGRADGARVERVYCTYLGNIVSRYRTFEFPEQSLPYRYREHSRGRVQLSPRAPPAAQLSIAVSLRGFIPSNFARAVVRLLFRDEPRIAFARCGDPTPLPPPPSRHNSASRPIDQS